MCVCVCSGVGGVCVWPYSMLIDCVVCATGENTSYLGCLINQFLQKIDFDRDFTLC